MTIKQFFKSKLMVLGLLLTLFGGLESQIGFMQPLFAQNPQYFGYFTIAVGLLVKLLRYLTTQPIWEK